MSDTIHISSVLVTADLSRLAPVKKLISNLEFAEISAVGPNGKLIVTLETPTEVALVQGLTDIQLMPGVVSAALCYHHAEEAQSKSRPVETQE